MILHCTSDLIVNNSCVKKENYEHLPFLVVEFGSGCDKNCHISITIYIQVSILKHQPTIFKKLLVKHVQDIMCIQKKRIGKCSMLLRYISHSLGESKNHDKIYFSVKK